MLEPVITGDCQLCPAEDVFVVLSINPVTETDEFICKACSDIREWESSEEYKTATVEGWQQTGQITDDAADYLLREDCE